MPLRPVQVETSWPCCQLQNIRVSFILAKFSVCINKVYFCEQAYIRGELDRKLTDQTTLLLLVLKIFVSVG